MESLESLREKELQRNRLPVWNSVGSGSDASSTDISEELNGMRLPSASPPQKREKKGMLGRIRHFTPSWFAVCMGTGAVSAVLHNFPYGNTHILSWFSRILFFVELFLFILFSAFTLARYIMFPYTWNRMIHHPVQSTFIGCFPMALGTLIIGAEYTYHDSNFGRTNLLYFLWGVWWIDLALSYCSGFGMVYFMITRQKHSMEEMLATWLLPMLPLVVVSTTGGVVAQSLNPVNHSLALLTVICSSVTISIGLTLSFMVTTTYLFRLIIHGQPPKGFIVSKFIPLGPLGQGGTGLLIFAQTIADLSSSQSIPSPLFSNPLAGPMTNFFGVLLAFYLWANGLLWTFLGAAGIVEVLSRNNVPFGVPFWGMIFPIGVYVLLSLQLGETLDSRFFRMFGSVLACCLFVLYTAISIRSIIMSIDGSLFYAPDLDDMPLLTVGPEIEDAPTPDDSGAELEV